MELKRCSVFHVSLRHLHYAFSNVSSNCMQEHSCTGCNYLISHHCVFSNCLLGAYKLHWLNLLSVWLFPGVGFQMCPQIACLSGCIITLVAFVWLLTTMHFEMCPQCACIIWYKVTLVALVQLFSSVCFQMSTQIAWIRAAKRTLVAFVWL